MTQEKKKKPTEPKCMTPGQYWEWRCSIEEVQKAKLNEKRIHLEREIMNKEIENRKLRLAMFKETVHAARKSVVSSEDEYKKFVQRLETELEIDFKNCVIDEVTYELKPVDGELSPNFEE